MRTRFHWPSGQMIAMAGIVVGILIALFSGTATQVFATDSQAPANPQPATAGDSVAFRNAAGVETVRVGEQVDGRNGVRVADSAGSTVYAFTKSPVASDVAGLGDGTFDGEPGYLRVGPPPYESVPLTWDAARGKWVTDKTPFAEVIGGAEHTHNPVTSTTYDLPGDPPGTVSAATTARFMIPNFKHLYDAGLRPEIHMTVGMTAPSGETISARLDVKDIADGSDDTNQPIIASSPALDSTSTVGCAVKILPWTALQFDTPPTGDDAFGVFKFKVTGGQGVVCSGWSTAWIRWTS